jgi:hypothetical protein
VALPCLLAIMCKDEPTNIPLGNPAGFLSTTESGLGLVHQLKTQNFDRITAWHSRQGYDVLTRCCYGRLTLMELLLPAGIAVGRELL